MPDQTVFASRREQVIPGLKETPADAFLTTALPNVRYLSAFTGSNGAVLVAPDRAILFTDPRYATQSLQESDCQVRICKGPIAKLVATQIKRMRLKSLAFEVNRIGFEDYDQLSELLKGVKLVPVSGLVETLRMVKSAGEIRAIRASVDLNSSALEQALRHFRPLMTEVDLAAEIDYRMRRMGADGVSFNTIVASGKRSALPHAHPSGHSIEASELLLIDMGAMVAGYASDMTRTYVVGKAGTKIRRMYEAVLNSQLAALDLVRPGVSCAKVDRTVRDVLRGYGFDKLFVHSTGHGLGLEIHERPRIGRKEAVKLAAGMTITIEPGVYDPEIGGIRIEDTVLVTERGCEVLTPTKKDLVVL